MNSDLDDALTIQEKLLALRNAKSGKELLFKAWKILKKFKIKPFVYKMIKNVVGSIFDFYSPLKKIFSSVTKIIKSKREVSTLRKQTKQEITELKHDTTHKINMKTLEVLKVSYDSLFNFKILKSFVSASLQVESKNVSKPEENSNFKDICRENFYLCKLEHGLKFIEEHFNGEKVCPRDIFIAGPKDNEEVLTEHRFVPLEGNAGIVGKFRIHENFFFSVSKTSILRIVTADSTDKDAIKKEFIKEVERKAKYWKQDCGSSLEGEISVEKLNSKADNIYVIIAENKLMAQCKVLYTAFCVDLVKLLKSKDFSNLRRSSDDLSSPLSPRHRTRLVEHKAELSSQMTSQLDRMFMKNICKLINKRIGFSKEEERLANEMIYKLIRSDGEQNLSDTNTKLKSNVKSLATVRNINGFKMSILDAVLVKYNQTIDKSSVEFYHKVNKYEQIMVSFKLKQFEPRNASELMNFYSSGHESCLNQDIIKIRLNDNSASQAIVKKDSESRSFREILEANIPENILKDAKKENLSYYLDFLSRYENQLHSFEIPFKEDDSFLTSGLINKKKIRYRYNLDIIDPHLYIDNVRDCKFTFQFAQVELKDETEGSFRIEFNYTDELRFPALSFKRAKSGEVGFENKFYVLFYLVNDSETDKQEISDIYEGISSKLAKFNYFPLISELSFTKNAVSIIKHEGLFTTEKAKLYTEVFIKPKKHKYEDEASSICNRVATK